MADVKDDRIVRVKGGRRRSRERDRRGRWQADRRRCVPRQRDGEAEDHEAGEGQRGRFVTAGKGSPSRSRFPRRRFQATRRRRRSSSSSRRFTIRMPRKVATNALQIAQPIELNDRKDLLNDFLSTVQLNNTDDSARRARRSRSPSSRQRTSGRRRQRDRRADRSVRVTSRCPAHRRRSISCRSAPRARKSCPRSCGRPETAGRATS